jgi:hypothetical protein
MTIGMFESRILPSHRPRPYGLLQVADVTIYGDGTTRWLAGVDAVALDVERLTGIDLTACDPPASGAWDLSATASGGPYEFRAFSSIIRAQCGTTSGPDTLEAMVTNTRAEHLAKLPDILDDELILGSVSGVTTNSLNTLATGSNPTGAVTGAALVGHAEALATYESIIMVPTALFPAAADAAVRDGDVWRTRIGNVLVPQSADANVYVLPAPLTVRLIEPDVSPRSWVQRDLNDVEAQSTIMGLFEFRADEVAKFDPTP